MRGLRELGGVARARAEAADVVAHSRHACSGRKLSNDARKSNLDRARNSAEGVGCVRTVILVYASGASKFYFLGRYLQNHGFCASCELVVTRRRKYEEDCILSLGADSEILHRAVQPSTAPKRLAHPPHLLPQPPIAMLSLAVNSLSFNAPALAPRAGRAAVRMQEAAMSPEAEAPPPEPVFSVKDLPGITDPLGFFDPLNFCEDASEGKIKFYREVELKHGRVAMLAALGFLVGEQFHPLWGGAIDVPSYIAFQETPLQTFWPAVVLVISVLEVFSVFSFNTPFGGEKWSIRSDYENGDLGFDPLGLKPESPAELKEMQTKELNNGRLAMIAIAGMIVQEGVTGAKLF